ncbi:helix-turn-helix transcriptional regulator [Kribbella lupini]|uniref:Helix-turn-helix transcriptional regulator n=1 Tax=Kribbella lupini TaxID=291602 RepID=A0ABP4KUU7_9ACTN
MVVRGEAGIGKTRLIREVCSGLGDGTHVLWGTCVHFGQATVPFAPLTGALKPWFARVDAANRRKVLTGVDDLGLIFPALGSARARETGRLLPLLDLVFNRIAETAPTVLVIDDLHWADHTSLDVLAYLISGFDDQRLAVMAACREEHRDEGHPLHGWLADMRRTPAFNEVQLDRLDLAATEVQIEGLLGRVVDVEFAAQVHERSGGNPYLTELLTRDMSDGERPDDLLELPAAIPTALGEALLSSWHCLSATARQTTRVLAAAGRPTEVDVLAGVLTKHGGVNPAQLSECLTEAQYQGVVLSDVDGRLWFRHPLLAEVLEDAMPPGDAARVHATYARVLEARSGTTRQCDAADLAVHYDRAGHADKSYQWSIAAANYAVNLHAPAEEAMNLERACSLWDEVSPDVRGPSWAHIDLLLRASDACDRAGRVEAAIGWLDHARGLVNPADEPLLASTLACALGDLERQRATPGKTRLSDSTQAVELTQQFPLSPQRARALAGLADAEKWDDRLPEAAMHADEAVRIARRSESGPALTYALNTRASVHLHRDQIESSLADAGEAHLLARSCGDSVQQAAAANWRVICLSELGLTTEATAVALQGFHDALRGGSPHWGYFLAALAAEGLLHSGRWQECQDLLREALAARRGPIPSAGLRMVAARLAVRSGNLAEAKQHLGRALELIPGDYPGLRMRMALAGAEVFTASGEPYKAFEWVKSRITGPNATPSPPRAEDLRAVKYRDQLVLPLAEAAAELAVAGRDAGDVDAASLARSGLDETLARWPRPPFTSPPDSEIQQMRRTLFAAAVARCGHDPKEAACWEQAIEKCEAAGAPWHTALSQYRCASALLTTGAASSAVGGLLRSAHRGAIGLGAQPLQHQIDTLARMARVTLREPAEPLNMDLPVPGLAHLTAREREIMTFLVAGRSNGEIAKELVISDKTVSVHVSSILRKTRTTTRVEAAALAERLTDRREG